MIGLLRGGLALGSLLCLALAGVRAGDAVERGFVDKLYKGPEGDVAKYVVFVPHAYGSKADKAYPLILFLHGAGETGSDGERQVKVGLGPAIKKQEKTFPFIAIFPQSQKRTWKADSDDGKRALAILAEVQKTYKVDPQRIYLTGLSMGGYGTWSFATTYPDRWAAIVPICGGGDPSQASKIKNLPCWCFHGDVDKAVPVKRSRDMIEAIKAAGSSPRYSEFPYVGHNSWDPAYATGELYSWLLKQQRP
jgi:predicted peptidase